MDQTQTPSEHPRLDALIAGYLEAVERGEAPDRNQIMAENPDLAAKLRAFFDDLDRVQRAAAISPDAPALNKPDAAHTSTVIRPNHEPTPGIIIAGRYKFLENIGEGGMGSVWVAEQLKPVKRKVAIKLIKPGMDSKQVLARFEAERQALAVMDHPNIAKVFDGGLTEQGRPYFVMEYVKGVPFTDYCDRARLPLKDRLALFIAVCSAVQHAHQKGIVHRDLKPSNILICLYDGHPVPKVIDFGLAKAMHQPLTEQSIFTGHGVMVGTPLYMSPEQAESNNLDIDTRTDIYSLGVVLYELLTGSTPLERQQLQKAAFDEVLRLIKEVEPPRPSLRLSGSESLASIAAQRSIDPKQLSRSLAGDLDWIVMKTLDKERSRRYETANGLARDIERFLNEEPVEACPPSTSYRVRKFVKRYKPQVTAATIVLLALVAGIIGTSWGLRKAKIAEEKAVASEGKTMQALADVTKERDATEEERKKGELARSAERLQRDKAERHLVSSLLRPIGASENEELNTAELRSLSEWAALGDSRLQILALEAVFQDPEQALRLANRGELVLQVAVALSPERRLRALEIVSSKQRDMTVDPRIRIAACWFAISLGSSDLPALEESIHYLSYPKRQMASIVVNMVELATSGNLPDQLSVFSTRGFDTLIEELQHLINESKGIETSSGLNRGYDTAGKVMKAIRLLTPFLTQEQVTRTWNAVFSTIGKNETFVYRDNLGIGEIGRTLAELAPHLTELQIRSGWDELARLLEKTEYHYDTDLIVSAMIDLAPHLSSEQIHHGLDLLILMQGRPGESESASILSSMVEPPLSVHLTDDQINRLVDRMVKSVDKLDDKTMSEAGSAIAALGPRLSKERLESNWDSLLTMLQTTKELDQLNAIGDMLVSLSPHLDAEYASRRADTLTGLFQSATIPNAQYGVFRAYSAIASKMSPVQVVVGWELLTKLVIDLKDPTPQLGAAEAISALAPCLPPERVADAWNGLLDLITKVPDWEYSYALRDAYTTLPDRLGPVQITEGWEKLFALLFDERVSSRSKEIMISTLVALAPRLSHSQSEEAGEDLILILKNTRDRGKAMHSIVLLYPLIPRLRTDQVNVVIDIAISQLEVDSHTENAFAIENILEGLVDRMNSNHVARCLDLSLKLLNNASERSVAATAMFLLSAIEPHLNTEQARQSAESLVVSLSRVDEAPSRSYTELLGELARRLEPTSRDRILTQAITNYLDRTASSPGFMRGRWGRTVTHEYHYLFFLVSSIEEPRSLGRLLSHPGCIGQSRDIMLMRFDEIVHYGGRSVFLKSQGDTAPKPGKEEPVFDLDNNRLRRRFEIPELADWIRKNWSDFDLEYQCPVTWHTVQQ